MGSIGESLGAIPGAITGGKQGFINGALKTVGAALGPAGQIASAFTAASGLLDKDKTPKPAGPAQAPAFNPSRPDPVSRPGGLTELANFTPEQERAALATKGTQSGLGADEDAYYKNLIQRSLIGENNEVASDTTSLLPVESQYFSKQGVNTSSIMDFLRQLKGTA